MAKAVLTNLFIAFAAISAVARAAADEVRVCQMPVMPPATPQNSDLLDANQFIEQETTRATGDDNSCDSASGNYSIAPSDGKSARFSYIDRQSLPPKISGGIKSILRYEEVDPQGKSRFAGLLVETNQGWYLAHVNPDVDVGGSHSWQWKQSLVLQEFTNYYFRATPSSTATFSKLDFNRDHTEATLADGRVLHYDSFATISKQLADHSDPAFAYELLESQRVRVPPEMYRLAQDPRFKDAEAKKEYSRMYDLIYANALALAKGDVRMALYISYLTVDLRERGPCGAIYGKRGHMLVPQSIFDHEVPQRTAVGNRMDAAQHFFGYALLSYDYGEKAPEAYTRLTKRNSWRNWLGRSLRESHVGSDSDLGGDTPTPTGITTSFNSTDLTQRPASDLKSDRLYNDLGTAFGARLKEFEAAQPSHVINSPRFEKDKRDIGFPADRSESWSFDPPETALLCTDHMMLTKANFGEKDYDPGDSSVMWFMCEAQPSDFHPSHFSIEWLLSDLPPKNYHHSFHSADPIYLLPVFADGPAANCEIKLTFDTTLDSSGNYLSQLRSKLPPQCREGQLRDERGLHYLLTDKKGRKVTILQKDTPPASQQP